MHSHGKLHAPATSWAPATQPEVRLCWPAGMCALAAVLTHADASLHASHRAVRTQLDKRLSAFKLECLGALTDPSAAAVSQAWALLSWKAQRCRAEVRKQPAAAPQEALHSFSVMHGLTAAAQMKRSPWCQAYMG